MDGRALIDKLKKKFDFDSDNQLAVFLGVTITRIKQVQQENPVSPEFMVKILKRFADSRIFGKSVIKEVKILSKLRTDKDVQDKYGINTGNWNHRKEPLSSRIIATSLINLQQSSASLALQNVVRPIAEFYPLAPVLSSHGVNYKLFPKSKSESVNSKSSAIESALKKSKGIYVFYDSRGKAIYVGKTERQNLLAEMTNALNRPRSAQSIYRVDHSKAIIQPKIRKVSVRIYEIAAFMSAYAVAPAAIPAIEALMVRAFANDLANIRMETF